MKDEAAPAPLPGGSVSNALRLPRGRTLELVRAPLVMGIINVTPDSFSDSGAHFDRKVATDAALQMEKEGAAIVDIGGESTRPGADEVTVAEELDRVVPVIAAIRARSDVVISVDTRRAVTARAAIAAGADIINDVSALRFDPRMAEVARESAVPVILMHMRGEPKTMQSFATYGDVVDDVAGELAGFLEAARAAGLSQLLVDPGIGFAKTAQHNLALLARCGELRHLAPVVIGASRKRFIGELTGREGAERVHGSLAAVGSAARGGAAVVRVHDVRATVDFLKVLHAIDRAGARMARTAAAAGKASA